MLNRRLPSCACVSVLNKFTVPTTLGTIIILATKIPNIIKTANEIKKSITDIKRLARDIAPYQPEQSQEIPDIVTSPTMNEEDIDMG